MIKKILGDISKIDYEDITEDMHLKDDLYLDDNDLIEVFDAIEDYFGIDIDNYENDFVYVSDLIALVD